MAVIGVTCYCFKRVFFLQVPLQDQPQPVPQALSGECRLAVLPDPVMLKQRPQSFIRSRAGTATRQCYVSHAGGYPGNNPQPFGPPPGAPGQVRVR